jgi:nicotinamidase-related amidase
MGSLPTDRKPPILLVIDLQEGLVSPPPEEGPRSTPDLTKNVSSILHHWRTRKWPVIHINHDGPELDHPLNRTLAPLTFAPHECSQPIEGEPVLVKQCGSAFVDPNLRLAERLRQWHGGGPDGAEVFVIGMDGAQCVNDNTRAANDLGFSVVVVADACASFGMPDYRGAGYKNIGAEETHAAAMSILANGFAKVITTEQALKV